MSTDMRSLLSRLGVVGRFAGLLALVAAIVFVLSLRGVGRAVFVPSAKEAKQMQKDQIAKLVADYTTSMDGHVKQFDGRSVFFVPAAPVPPPPPAPDKPVDEKKDPPPPPPPATYGGPKLIAMINGVAWFDDGKRLGASDEAKDNLRVKEILAPWNAVVDWKGVEFKISLFDRDGVVYPVKKPEPPKDAAKEPAKDTAATDIKAGDKPAPKPEADAPAKPSEAKAELKPETKPEDSKPADPKPESPKPTDPPPAPTGQTGTHE